MKFELKTIRDLDLNGKRIFLRTGWDVPFKKSKIKNQKSKIEVADDLRIRESLPTIRYLFEHGVTRLTIAFHIDRPEGKVVADLSVKPVVMGLIGLLSEVISRQNPNSKIQMPNKTQIPKSQIFSHSDFGFNLKLGFRISDLKIAGSLAAYEIIGVPIPMAILDNLRFDPREEANDESFARQLAQGHDLYINDAFSNCHRQHASMVAITKFLPAYAGLLVEDEIRHLSMLRGNPPRPFIVIIGGAKIEDKLPVIETFAKKADAVLVGGKTGLEYAKGIRKLEIKKNVFSPLDDNAGYDIGPKTTKLFTDKINAAQTIFWNGNMGMSENAAYATGTTKITKTIARSNAKIKIAGGGDTTVFIHQHGLADRFTFLSSGGGATIDYLAGQEMPGLDALRAN